MKKKPVKKMVGGGDLLGSISPLYGIATGRGAFGKLADAGLSPAGMIAKASRDKKKKKKNEQSPQGMAVAPQRMREGGKVGRGDGCCMRGKTKGRMV